MSGLGTKLENLSSQFKKYELIKVPVYQRSYAWEPSHVQEFWDDILDSLKDGRDKYFIGPIVTKNITDNKVELIDGQQRLTTTLALLSIIRRLYYFEYKTTGDEKLFKYYGKIESRFIVSDSFDEDSEFERYEMNEENSYVFRKFILKDTNREDLKSYLKLNKLTKDDSNFKLISCVLLLWDLVENYCENSFDDGKLRDLVQYLLENLQILNINVSDESDAFLIFETINDRGRDLDTMDLVKNLMFSKVNGRQFDVVKGNWIKMMENLGRTKSTSEYLSQYWISKYGHFTKTLLFKLIKEEVGSSAKSVVAFSDSLYESSKVYSALKNTDDSFWDDYSIKCRENIKTLRMLGATAVNPLLMAASKLLDTNEFCKLTGYLITIQLRYIIVSDFPTNHYSKVMSEIPLLINEAQTSRAIKIARLLKDRGLYVPDREFKECFYRFGSKDAKRIKYILSKIEESYSDSDKSINPDPEVVNIEHLLPQKGPCEHWTKEETKIESEDYETYAYLIGNQMLSNSKLNAKVKRSKFDVKKSQLISESSSIKTTYYANKFSTWGKSEIEDRQAYLCEKVCDIWKIQF
ncbi:DUF262 domain-containing protein [Vibrio diabolicus]|uniref:DUF262 domain-containing protein n=1 Tax=Vibrio diabolicus TaxID=50719 RepID=UPI0040687137